MDMGMILQGSSPGVQDAEEAGNIGTDVILIEGQFFDGVRGSLEQSGVSQALVLSDEVAQRFWDRKRNEEMVAGELAVDLFLQPLLSFMGLASWAMAMYLCRTLGGHRLTEIGKVLGLDKYSSVSSACISMKGRVENEYRLARRAHNVERLLKSQQ